MTEKFPTTLVIPAEAYRFCLTAFLGDCWTEEEFDRVRDPTGLREPTIDDFYEEPPMLRRLLRKPFPRRRKMVAKWPREAQWRLAESVRYRYGLAGPHRGIRIKTRRLGDWLEDEPEFCDSFEAHGTRILKDLRTTSGWSRWVWMGGDADVGRYLGCWAEPIWMNEASA